MAIREIAASRSFIIPRLLLFGSKLLDLASKLDDKQKNKEMSFVSYLSVEWPVFSYPDIYCGSGLRCNLGNSTSLNAQCKQHWMTARWANGRHWVAARWANGQHWTVPQWSNRCTGCHQRRHHVTSFPGVLVSLRIGMLQMSVIGEREVVLLVSWFSDKRRDCR